MDRTSSIVTRLALDGITADPQAQPRAAMRMDRVAEYAEDMQRGDALPPVVAFGTEQQCWLADGFHRYFAAQGAGIETLAVDLRAGGLRDAILFSCGANATHGERRSNEDKRRAVMRLLGDEEWGAWSDREIGRRCGVDHKMVGGLRPKPEADTGEVPQYGRTFTHPKTGKPTTMKTGRIGGSRAPRADASAPTMPHAPAETSGPPTPIDVFHRERDRMFLFHALEKAIEGVADLKMSPVEAVQKFPSSLAHAVDPDRLRAAGNALIQFADLWARRETTDVRAAE